MVSEEKHTDMQADAKHTRGHIHPITATLSELVHICSDIGFSVALGQELEEEYYNFDALNIPKDHPAREMWDTFWIKNKPGMLLRTHTSPMQIRYMEEHTPPIKIIVPGKVFRNESTDATHEAQFFQLEGLCITETTSLADMKGTIEIILKTFFGEDINFRYRPSYFPFTEPSIEVDMQKKGTDTWIEILGCGMVHPRLLTRAGIDPQTYQGFAFGFGADRFAVLRHQFDDIRSLYTGDLQVVTQF